MTQAAPSTDQAAPENEAGGGYVKVSRRTRRLFRGAPLSWLPVWTELELRLWHRGWRRVAASEIAEECGLCLRTVKRVLFAFEALGFLNIRHTKGGSYKNTCWLQLLELPKILEIPDSLRRCGERNRTQQRRAQHAPPAAAVDQAAAEIFLGELARAPSTEAQPGQAERTWQGILGELREDARMELQGYVSHVRGISRGMLVLESHLVDFVATNFSDALRYWGRKHGVDDVIVVEPGQAWPPPAASGDVVRAEESIADQAVRMVQEFFHVVHAVPAEEAARLRLGAGLLRRDVELATGLLEVNGLAAWNYVSRACQRLARQSYRGETFLYLIPHLAHVGAQWPGQDADRPAGVRRTRAA